MNRLLPWLRLLRAGTLLSPGCDVLAGLCVMGMAWSPDAVRIIVASICLYAAGMVFNDVADVREDRLQRPERPIPRGDISLGTAAALGAVLLTLGLLCSPPEFRMHHGLIAVLVLLYDFACKKVALLGALTMGTLRGLNLLTAAAPIWLSGAANPEEQPALTVLLAAAACYAIYVIAVTILGIYEDTERVSPRALVTVQTAPLIAGFVGLLSVQGGLWPAPALATIPIVLFARRNRLRTSWDQASIRQSMMYLLLGTMLYTALLAVAKDCWPEALGIALCIPVARWIARHISLT